MSAPLPDPDASALRDHLASRDCPCPGCGYNLRGLAGSSCPECNQPLRLSVALSEPGLGRFLTTMLPLAIVGGAFAIGLAVICVVSMTGFGWPSRRERGLLLVYPTLAAIGLLLPAILLIRPRGRSWLRRLEPRLARRAAAISILVSSALIVFWTAWVSRFR